MNFYGKKMFLLLLLINGGTVFSGTAIPPRIKKLSPLNEFVFKNNLSQDILPLLEGKSDWEKDQIMNYIYYGENDDLTLPWGTSSSDKASIDVIRRRIYDLSYTNPQEAESTVKLTSICLKSLPKRGIKNSWTTILLCFQLAKDAVDSNKY